MAIALYARKSVERENSISCETQIEYCKAMIKPSERDEKIIAFTDNGFSGSNTNRTGFLKMMRQVESGEISKLIVYRLDRISRSLADFVNILGILKEHSVKFVSSQESFDTGSPYGEMIVKILMVFAEFERQSTVERVKQAYGHRSEIGLYMGGRRPYGFELADAVVHNIKTKMYVPVECEIEQVKFIFETYREPDVSLRHLTDILMQNNIVPSCGSWSAARLSGILKNPVYAAADNDIYQYFAKKNTNIVSDVSSFDGVHGLQLYGKTTHSAPDWSDMKLVVMPHEGVIRSDTWLKCRKKLEQNRQIGNSSCNQTSWLGGKIACKKCGRTMTVTRGGRRRDGTVTRYFSCTGKSHSRICGGPAVTLYADSLEAMAYGRILKKIGSLKNFPQKPSAERESRLNALRNRVSEINIAEKKLVNTILSNESCGELISLLNEKAKILAEEKSGIEKKIKALEKDAGTISGIDLAEQWKRADFKEKKAVCGVLMDKIYIYEDGTAEILWNI